MLSNLKVKVQYVAALLLIMVGLFVFMAKQANEIQQSQSVIAEQQSELVTYKNDLGLETAKRVAAEVDKKNLKRYYEKEIEEIQRKHDVKVKNIESLVLAQTSTVIRDTVQVKVVSKTPVYSGKEVEINTIDWSKVKLNFSNSDKWHSLSGVVDSGRLRYEFVSYDSISFVLHRNRTGFLGLGHKELVIEGSSSNPYTKVEGIKAVKVGDERRRPFGIGLSFGYGMSDKGLSPVVSIGLTYNFIRF